jgi:hypothetical protein
MKNYIFLFMFIFCCTLVYSHSSANCKGNCYDGFGKYSFSNGNIYEGEWKNGQKHGYGTFFWKSGQRFEGIFKDDKMNQGTCFYSNGDRYVGVFNQKEQRHGQGTLYYANGKIDQGIWENDRFITSKDIATSDSKLSISMAQSKNERITSMPHTAQFGNYHALVIGNNNYKYLTKLETAINDAANVADLLRKEYNFIVDLIIDASRADILRALNKARRTLTEKDNLLVYYAGHGWLDKDADQGYWLPIDAEDNSNINWISNATITDTLRAMSAKHVMLVADSCYSGKLTRGIKISIKKADYLTRLSKKKARTVLTSGGLEPVMDSDGGKNSVFAKAFIDALRENQNIMDGHQLFSIIRRPVMLNSDQTPEYSDIRKSGHDGGDFLFVR